MESLDMRKFLILLSFIILSGCVPSLYPLYTEKDLILEPLLLGEWYEANGDSIWLFNRLGNKSYELISTSFQNKTSCRFKVHLIKLGDYLFLDFYPEKRTQNDKFYDQSFIATHIFSRVTINKDKLSIAMLNPIIIDSMAKKKQIKIPYKRIENKIILTASTNELQKFILKYAENKALFSYTFVFERHNKQEIKQGEE